jgi:hypothetical protein
MSLPLNKGKPWGNDEIVQLLKEIQKKVSIDDIALRHKRTVGGIRSRLREIAADYYFNDERPIEQIIKYTGLSEEEILDAIERRKIRIKVSEEKQEKIFQNTKEDTCFEIAKNDEILQNLKDIKLLLLELNNKFNHIVSPIKIETGTVGWGGSAV